MKEFFKQFGIIFVGIFLGFLLLTGLLIAVFYWIKFMDIMMGMMP